MYGPTAIPRGRRSSLTSSPAGVPAVRLFCSFSSNLCIYNLKDCNIFYGRIGIKTAWSVYVGVHQIGRNIRKQRKKILKSDGSEFLD